MRMTRLSHGGLDATFDDQRVAGIENFGALEFYVRAATMSRAADGVSVSLTVLGLSSGMAPRGSLTSFGLRHRAGEQPAARTENALDVLAGDVVVASGDGRFAEHGNSRGEVFDRKLVLAANAISVPHRIKQL